MDDFDFEEYLNKRMQKSAQNRMEAKDQPDRLGGGFRQALDADGRPMPGTSMGVPTFGEVIPGTMVGNMQGVLQGGRPVAPQLQQHLQGGISDLSKQ